jgi:hypothetical protein
MAATTIERALAAGDQAKKKLYEIMQKSEKSMHMAKTLVEVAGAAFGQGVLAGRFGANGEYAIMGVPVDLASGVLAVGVGATGLLGDQYSDDITNLGMGSLAYAAGRMGASVGLTLAHAGTTAAAPPAGTVATKGVIAAGASSHGAFGAPVMSPAEMAAYARAAA